MKELLALLIVACLLGCADSVSAQRAGDVPYEQATYEVSDSPTKVILEVVTIAGLTSRGHAMAVYGNGKVVLQRVYNGRKVIAEHVIQLDDEQTRALVDLAVVNGLAEWESSTLLAWMRQLRGQTPLVADGLRVQVALHLESYQRGDYSKTPLTHRFGTKSPGQFSEWFPEIKQFRGAAKLVKWLESRWEDSADRVEG